MPLAFALLIGLVTGCTSNGSSPTPAAGSSASAAASPQPTADAAAQRVVAAAIRRTGQLHSYAFHATTRIVASKVARTSITGRVTRHGLTYQFRSAQRRTEVVRVPAGTYVRRAHHSWSRLVHPHAVLKPTRTLVALLRGLVPLHVRPGAAGRTRVSGLLPAAAAKRAGLPAESRSAAVVVTVDHQRRVHALAVRTRGLAGARTVTITVATTYLRFGHVKSVRKPA